MYSVVLMMAMTTGAETPEFGRHGCTGCNGGYAGCSGSGYVGCSGALYANGCSGGGGHGLFGGGHGSCHGGGGLFGGCHGGGGLFGGKHGCHGGSSCHGGYGCNGSGYGCTGSGYGCNGSGYGYGCTGGAAYGYGCTGGAIYGGAGYGCTGGTIVVPDMGKPKLEEKPKDMPKDKEEISAPATLTVNLPVNAKLSIDETVTSPKAVTTRVFETPVLKGGRDYSYTLTAEFVHEGKPVVVTKKVAIRAGAEISVTMSASDASVAAR